VVDIYIGIGSNIDPFKNIPAALEVLRDAFPSIKFSRVFESEAVGFDGDNFLNLVAFFNSEDLISNGLVVEETVSSSLAQENVKNQNKQLSILIKQLKNIENDLGRQRGSKKFSDRNIDIDILLFGELEITNPIELPRGEILENAYVLWPLSELAPKLTIPNSNITYVKCWTQFDKSLQELIPVELV
jgi:2-amino-4-hydroxy-6-hydroxymethyldihydropteridine diphosphokinase